MANGGGALRANLAEVGDIFGRKDVFEIEERDGSAALANWTASSRRNALVHVVEQFDFVAEGFAALCAATSQRGALRSGFEHRAVLQRL